MKEKKHIDELFKDSFKNFEASPSPEVWSNIQAQLKKDKEDRKVIPLWWKLGGVAALLALLFTIGTQVLGPSDNMDKLKNALKKHKVSVSFRGDFVRVSPHVYNDKLDMNRLVRAFEEVFV